VPVGKKGRKMHFTINDHLEPVFNNGFINAIAHCDVMETVIASPNTTNKDCVNLLVSLINGNF